MVLVLPLPTIQARVSGRWVTVSPLQVERDDSIRMLSPGGEVMGNDKGENIFRVTGCLDITCVPLSKVGVEGRA